MPLKERKEILHSLNSDDDGPEGELQPIMVKLSQADQFISTANPDEAAWIARSEYAVLFTNPPDSILPALEMESLFYKIPRNNWVLKFPHP